MPSLLGLRHPVAYSRGIRQVPALEATVRRLLRVVGVGVAASCGPADVDRLPRPAPAETVGDTGPAVPTCLDEPAAVEVGTGVDAFYPLDDLDPVRVVFGSQGGYHVVTGLRACHLDARVAWVTTITHEGSGLVLSRLDYAQRTTDDGPCCGASYGHTGYLYDAYGGPLLEIGGEPTGEFLDGEVLAITIEARDPAGRTAAASRRVVARFR